MTFLVLDDGASSYSVQVGNGITACIDTDFSGNLSIPSTVSHGDATYNVLRIGERAFDGCTGLKTLTISEGVTEIVNYAFNGSGIETLVLPASVRDISVLATSYMPSLSQYIVDTGNSVYSSEDGVLYTKPSNGTRALMAYPLGKNTEAFSFSVPTDVVAIYSYAFLGNEKLTEIVLPEGLARIYPQAFAYTGITTVSIPSMVSILRSGAFSRCANLKTVILANKELAATATENNAFAENNSNNMTLCVPMQYLSDYQCEPWTDWFATIEGGFPINATNFPDEGFRTQLLNMELGQDAFLSEEEVQAADELELTDTDNISDLTGIEYFTDLWGLYVPWNKLTTMNLSANKKLRRIDCYENQISGAGMDEMVDNLPAVTGGQIYLYDSNDSHYPEANEMTPEQVAIANGKGWTVMVYDEEVKAWRETAGIVRITEEHFPDANFRSYVADLDDLSCTGAVTQEDRDGSELPLDCLGIGDLTGIEYFPNLDGIYFSGNQLTTADLSANKSVTNIYCEQNQMSGAGMDAFLASLPTVTDGSITAYYACNSRYPEANEMTPEQVAVAKGKGWQVLVWDETLGTAKNKGAWRETDGWWRFTEERFPDANFRNYLPSFLGVCCTDALTKEEADDIEDLEVDARGVADLKGIELFANLGYLYVIDNELTTIDLSDNTQLYSLYCSENQIKGVGMDALIASLRTMPEGKTGKLYACDLASSDEGNEITAKQVEAAKAKGWTTYAYDGNDWVEYGGTATGIVAPAVQDASERVSRYNLHGQRVGKGHKGVVIENGRKHVVR